jgi:hypothetical protein
MSTSAEKAQDTSFNSKESQRRDSLIIDVINSNVNDSEHVQIGSS